MLEERYEEVYKRLLKLYRLLSKKTYGVYLAPQVFLDDIDSIRNRSTFTFEGTIGDDNYYEEQQLKNMTVESILKVVPNIAMNEYGTGYQISFQRADRNLIEIYENIQEYVGLWCELIKAFPTQPHPPLTELRTLEDLAFIIFEPYKKIKTFKIRMENRKLGKQESGLQSKGLLGLAGIFSLYRMTSGETEEGISYVSNVDLLEESMNSEVSSKVLKEISGLGELLALTKPDSVSSGIEDPNWLFGG